MGRITRDDIKKSKVADLNKHLFEEPGQTNNKSKYGNTPTMVDGIRFDSKKEAKRYKALLLLLKAGVIAFLRRQVKYQLNDGGKFSYEYIADFVYLDTKIMKEVVSW